MPVFNKSYVWGDNESMINSATVPDAKLHKRHNILSFHFVRSMIACGYINLQHIRSESNIADILSKHWGYQSSYDLIRPIFHHTGNTASLYIDDTLSVDCYTNNTDNFVYGDIPTDGEYEKEDSSSLSFDVVEPESSEVPSVTSSLRRAMKNTRMVHKNTVFETDGVT